MDVDNFYEHSRLHFIGDWKYTAKDIMQKLVAERSIGEAIGSSILPNENDEDMFEKNGQLIAQCVAHVDMDCFFASIAMRSREELREIPLAVCYEGKYSEISSCNYAARGKGVHAGMFLGKAQTLCPELRVAPYEFNAYKGAMQTIYGLTLEMLGELHGKMEDVDDIDGPHSTLFSASLQTAVEVASIDDFLIAARFSRDSSGLSQAEKAEWVSLQQSTVLTFIEGLRTEIQDRTGCTASAGIARNFLLARILTESAKPNGQKAFFGTSPETKSFLREISIAALPGVGPVLSHKIKAKLGATKCGDLQLFDVQFLQRFLGTGMGRKVHRACRGLSDRQVVPTLPTSEPSALHKGKVLGCCMNYGVRPKNVTDVHRLLQNLSRNVSEKLLLCGVTASRVTLTIKYRHPDATVESVKKGAHGWCKEVTATGALNPPRSDQQVIFSTLTEVFRSVRVVVEDIRGLSVKVKVDAKQPSPEKAVKEQGATLTQIYKRKSSAKVEKSVKRKLQLDEASRLQFVDAHALSETRHDAPIRLHTHCQPQDERVVETHLHALQESIASRKYKTVQSVMTIFKDRLSPETYSVIRRSIWKWTVRNEGAKLVLP